MAQITIVRLKITPTLQHFREDKGVASQICKYLPSDSILAPLKLAIRLKFFRDLVMPSRDSSSGDIEPPAQGDAGFSRHFPAKVNRHIPG